VKSHGKTLLNKQYMLKKMKDRKVKTDPVPGWVPVEGEG
jgi:hypothetical protein